MSAEGFAFRNSFANEEDIALYEEAYDEFYYRVRRDLYLKGYRIYTSLKPEKQEMLQKAFDEETSSFTDMTAEGVYMLQAEGTCIDTKRRHDAGASAVIIPFCLYKMFVTVSDVS